MNLFKKKVEKRTIHLDLTMETIFVEEVQSAPVYSDRKTVEEMEYESKMLTQKSLFELGRATAKEAMEAENRTAMDAFFEGGMEEFSLEKSLLDAVYQTPVSMIELFLEKQCEEVPCLQGIKSKVVKKDVLKLLIFQQILKKRLEKKEEEVEEEKSAKEEFERQTEEMMDELEELEKKEEGWKQAMYERDQTIAILRSENWRLKELESEKNWGYFAMTFYYVAFVALLLKIYVF